MGKISVIVPVYNSSNYLSKCLDSISNQSLKDIEIICIDNGSTDNSVQIIKEKQKLDNRIVLKEIGRSNAGDARNCGIQLSSGKYLYFIDSDDWIDQDTLSYIYNYAEFNNLDITIFKYKVFNEQTQKESDSKGFSCVPGILLINADTLFQTTNFAVWNKLYKTEIIKDNNITFDSLRSTNDVTFSCLALACSNKIGLLDKSFYHYRTNRVGSITKSKSENLFDFNLALKSLKENLQKRGLFNKFYQTYINTCGEVLYFTNRIINDEAKIQFQNKIFDICQELSIDINKIQNITFKKFLSAFTPKFSIIIPVYNSEKYISKCLDSILEQTSDSYEIICVDDGSSDKSLDILNKYAAQNCKIMVLSEANLKCGTARNLALKYASGKYVWFVDSDDWISEDALQIISNNIDKYNPDIVCFEACNVYENGVQEQSNGQKINITGSMSGCSKSDNLSIIKNSIPISACLFSVKREFLDKYNIRFDDYCFFEDNLFLIKCFHYSSVISYEKKIIYKRRKHNNSITSNWNKNFLDYLLVIRNIYDFYMAIGIDSYNKILSYCKTAYSKYSSFSIDDQKKYLLNFICTLKYIGLYKTFGEDKFGKKPFYTELQDWWTSHKKSNIDIDNPKTLCEAIQWLKISDCERYKTILADKLLVREFIKSCIGNKYLVNLLGSYGSFDEIDFNSFNQPVVLKCNHGSGWNHIIQDPIHFDKDNIKSDFDRWMKTDYAKLSYELHYSCIKRRIIAEEYIDPKFSKFEYQVYCINNKPEYVSVETIKDLPTHQRCIFNTKGEKLDFMISPNRYSVMDEEYVDKSTILECVGLSNLLLNNIKTKFVRFDFIEYHGNIKFREITFTPGSGLSIYNPESYDYKFGSMLSIGKATPILQHIKAADIKTESKQSTQIDCAIRIPKISGPAKFIRYSVNSIPGLSILTPADFWDSTPDNNLKRLCKNNQTIYSWAWSKLHKKSIYDNYPVENAARKLTQDEENTIISVLHEYPEILSNS